MSDDRQQAKYLLVHYLQLIAVRAGLKWDNDLTVEVESIVDHIIDAAVTAARTAPPTR